MLLQFFASFSFSALLIVCLMRFFSMCAGESSLEDRESKVDIGNHKIRVMEMD